MAASRKLKRQRQKSEKKAQAVAQKRAPEKAQTLDKGALRAQASKQRFARPGAEQLWLSMLGWEQARRERIWLCEALHDGMLWKRYTLAADGADEDMPEYTADAMFAGFASRCPKRAEALSAEALGDVVDLWLEEGDRFVPGTPASRWSRVAELCEQSGLGPCSDAELEADWEVWISMAFADQPHRVLLESLRNAESAAASLNTITQSENMSALAGMFRLLWSSLAYGDETTFKRVRGWLDEVEEAAPSKAASAASD